MSERRRQKQLELINFQEKRRTRFGGALLKRSNPKGPRPLSTKSATHLVLRSSMAKGIRSLLKKERVIRAIVERQGKLFGVKVYRLANAGNHLHLIILPRSRVAYHGFIRAISGLVAREILGTQRGKAGAEVGGHARFWDARPFTRIVTWGREFEIVSRYLMQNRLEAMGFVPYQPRSAKREAPA